MATGRSKSTFPRFDDADVQIRLSNKEKDIYHLHSFILGLHSPYFKASISARWTVGTLVATTGDKVKWKYELRFEEGQGEGFLLRHDSSTTTTIIDSSPGAIIFTPKPILVKAREDCAIAHRDFLRILYHMPLIASTDNFNVAKDQTGCLVSVAEMYGCNDLIGRHVRAHLLHFKDSSRALRWCAEHTSMAIDYSLTVRSDWIFKEAVVHLISCFGTYKADSKYPAETELRVQTLIKEKTEELQQSLLRAINSLLLCNSGNTGVSDIHDLIAQSFFRYVVAAATPHGPPFPPAYAKVFRTLARGKLPKGPGLMNFSEFSAQIGHTARSEVRECAECSRCKVALGRLLEGAKSSIDGLLKNPTGVRAKTYSSIGLEAPLLCVKITNDDLPWNAQSS